MTREIKFRAWDKDTKQMSVSTMHPGERFFDFKNGTVDALLWGAERLVVMQFTGLKDKNGKEIYEGDIYRVAGNHRYEIVWLEELEYDEKCAGWGLRHIKGALPPFLVDTFAIGHGEVIGNIYENPDLLK